MSSIHKTTARKTTVDGIEFGSAAEARRYSELRLMERAGEIEELTLQPRYRIFDHGGVTLHYTADFSYEGGCGRHVVEEVKGMADTAYLMRRKMFLGLHPTLPLYEIRGRKRLRVYLTAGGVCRTKDEATTKPRTPRTRAAKKEAK